MEGSEERHIEREWQSNVEMCVYGSFYSYEKDVRDSDWW